MDPFTLSMLFSAGSGIAGMFGANQSADAMQAALEAEIARQEGFDDRMFAVNQRSLGRYGGARAGVRRQGRRVGDYLSKEAKGGRDMTASASNLVQQTQAQLGSQARRESAASGMAKGRARGMADYFGGMTRGLNNDAIALSQLGDMRTRSLQNMGLDVQAAQKQGSGWNTVADLFSAGSSLASGYGNSQLMSQLLQSNLGGSPAAPTDPWAGLRVASSPYVRVA